MKRRTKMIVSLGSMVLTMLVLPILIVAFAPADGAMGLFFMLFFAVYPAQIICFGMVAGTDLKHLWWLPVAGALGFPLLVSIAIGEMVLDLYVYSAIYLPISAVAMAGFHFGKKYKEKHK